MDQPGLPFFNSDRCPELHDIATRAAANRTYRKPKLPVAEQAKRWIESHPKVYDLFVKHALKVAGARKHYGAKAIVEFIRYHEEVEHGREFKCPNAFTTYMALRFMDENPEHANLFKTTKRK
jgi:hypothetical protein